MNILDAYIKKHGQFVILILGMPCSNKSAIAKELVVDLKLPIININDYLKQNSYIEETVKNVGFKLYEHPDNYDWEKLNKDVNEKKSSGIILYGNYIDKLKITFKINFCFFFSMGLDLCKSVLTENKMLPYASNDEKVKIYFEHIFKPIYEKLKTTLLINKYFNVKKETLFENMYDDVFNNIMNLIKQNI
jgi:shikimate kinase